jgi:hypothetical protein
VEDRAPKKGERAVSEAAAGGGGRAEAERPLVQRSLQDEDFRQRLLDDPKGSVEQELATRLPEDVEVRVVEESAQSIYLVLPVRSADLQTGELSDQDLEQVAGGDLSTDSGSTCAGDWSNTCQGRC